MRRITVSVYDTRYEPLLPKKKPRAKSLSDRQVILQMTAGNGVFFFVTERTDIGMQKPMIHMNLNQINRHETDNT